MPSTAPRSMKPATHVCPASCNAYDTGCEMFANLADGTMPVTTAATATYSTAHTASDAMMPIGRSRLGSFTSSAADDTESKPMNAKNMTAAAPNTPFQPFGMNGCQLAGVTWNTPTPITSSTTVTLIATMTLLMRADSRTPTDNSAVIAIITRNAGRLKNVSWPGSAPGAAVSATGNDTPKPDSNDCR